jgi:hypothetical protein
LKAPPNRIAARPSITSSEPRIGTGIPLTKPQQYTPAARAQANDFRLRNLLAQCLGWMADGHLLIRQYTPGGARWSLNGRHIPEAVALRISKVRDIEVADAGLFPDGDFAQSFRIRK